jgi:polyhydroxyalkanoate synthesis regulator phasin
LLDPATEAHVLDVMRTLLLAAVGGIDLTEEKLRSVIDELVRRGELAADEARDLAAQWKRSATARRGQLDERMRRAAEDAMGRLNVASHQSVIDLERRVAALEAVAAAEVAPGDG